MPGRSAHHRAIAAAMAGLEGVGEAPLDEALDRLAAAAQVLSEVLQTSAGSVQSGLPGLETK